MNPRTAPLSCGIAFWFAVHSCSVAEEPELRRPIAVQNLSTASHIVTANRNGTLSVVDVESGTVKRETKLGKQLSDLVPIPRHNDFFLATDEAAHELIAVRILEEQTEAIKNLSISPYPVSIATTSDGSLAGVASLWSRRLSIVSVGERLKLNVERVIDLPFAPRKQIVLPGDEQLIVFDSFGGRLAVVEIATGKIVLERDFPATPCEGWCFRRIGNDSGVAPDAQSTWARQPERYPLGAA